MLHNHRQPQPNSGVFSHLAVVVHEVCLNHHQMRYLQAMHHMVRTWQMVMMFHEVQSLVFGRSVARLWAWGAT